LQELSCIRERLFVVHNRFAPWLRRPMRSEQPR
jgi:hypothetical protein